MARLMALENVAFYASEYLRGPAAPPYNGRFLVAEHHEEWADLANNHKRLRIMAARDHGKSFFWTFAYPLWMAENHPGEKGYIIAASDTRAQEILIGVQREVEQNPKLAHLLPKVDKGKVKKNARWNANCLEFANGFVLYGRGFGSKVRGGHPIFIVCDDVLNDETAYSENVRTKTVDYFLNALTNMIVPGGQIVVIGTPFHANDLYGQLAHIPGYHTAEYPALLMEDDGKLKTDAAGNHIPMWPDRYSLVLLKERENEIKALRFAREFLCQPVADLASLFPVLLFRGKVERFDMKLGQPIRYYEERGILDRYAGVDFALSNTIGSDYTVVFVMGVDKYGRRYVIDILRERGLSFSEQKSMIKTAAVKYGLGMIYVESNQAQRIFGDELIKETDLPIKPFYTTNEKHSLEQGLPSLRTLLENEKVLIPRGDEYSVRCTEIWIDEMRSHTLSNGRVVSVGEHDDTAMAFWICDQAIRKGAFTFSFEEEPEDEAALAESIALGESEADDPWGDFIPGAVPREGRPRTTNARIVDEDFVDDDLDNPRRPNGHPKSTQPQQSTELRPYAEVRPVDKAPTASQLMGAMWRN